MRKTVSFLAGLLAGIAAGAIAAILLAPYSGPELQERLRTRAQGLIEEGKRAAAARRARHSAALAGHPCEGCASAQPLQGLSLTPQSSVGRAPAGW